MDYVKKAEAMVENWLRKAPHLPVGGRKWLADNIWWIALIGAIASGLSVIIGLFGLAAIFTFLAGNATYYSYYVVAPYTGWSVVTSILAIVFVLISGILLASAVKPLQAKVQKGWTLLFAVVLVEAVSVVVNSIVSLNPLSFIFGIIFGAIGIAIGAYFTFEIRSYFAHTTKAAAKK